MKGVPLFLIPVIGAERGFCGAEGKDEGVGIMREGGAGVVGMFIL